MQPETINQGNNKSFLYKLHEAKWNLLIRRNQTTSTVRMDRWTIIYPSKHESVAKNVYQTLHKVVKPMGLYIYIYVEFAVILLCLINHQYHIYI